MARLARMAAFSNSGDSLELRASDTDRERVADRLREAAAQGQITMDELEERLETTYSAKTFGDLVPVTADLPAHAGVGAGILLAPGSAPTGGAVARIGGTPSHRTWAVAIMGGSVRKGFWTIPSRYRSLAIMGGVEIDLREANFAEAETVIHVFALMGGIEVKVPEGVVVHVDAIGIMGGVDGDSAEASNPVTDGVTVPVVRIVGLAVMGGIVVSRKPLKRKKKSAELTDGTRNGRELE
jgi:hypothetical protein